MDIEERTQLLQRPKGRRDVIARAWHAAIATTSFVPFTVAELRTYFADMTNLAISFLLAESSDARPAWEIGATLVCLRYTKPEALERTQQILGDHLVRDLSAQQIAALYPRLVILISSIASAFERQAHDTLLVEQEQIRSALVTDLRRAEDELRRSNEELEQKVKERTDELRAAHERLLIVLDGLESYVYVADMQTYELLFANRLIRAAYGDVVGGICWQALRPGQMGPCSDCTNAMLVSPDGQPAGGCAWELENPTTGHSFLIQNRAIRWLDGRLVRLGIATDITAQKRAESALRAREVKQ